MTARLKYVRIARAELRYFKNHASNDMKRSKRAAYPHHCRAYLSRKRKVKTKIGKTPDPSSLITDLDDSLVVVVR